MSLGSFVYEFLDYRVFGWVFEPMFSFSQRRKLWRARLEPKKFPFHPWETLWLCTVCEFSEFAFGGMFLGWLSGMFPDT